MFQFENFSVCVFKKQFLSLLNFSFWAWVVFLILFNCLLVFSWILLGFFRIIIWFFSKHFKNFLCCGIYYWRIIVFLWRCQVSLLAHVSCVPTLTSVHLVRQSPLLISCRSFLSSKYFSRGCVSYCWLGGVFWFEFWVGATVISPLVFIVSSVWAPLYSRLEMWQQCWSFTGSGDQHVCCFPIAVVGVRGAGQQFLGSPLVPPVEMEQLPGMDRLRVLTCIVWGPPHCGGNLWVWLVLAQSWGTAKSEWLQQGEDIVHLSCGMCTGLSTCHRGL